MLILKWITDLNYKSEICHTKMLRLIKDTIKEYKMKGDCSPRYAVSVSTELFLPFTVPTHVLYLWVPLRSLIRNLAIDIYMSYFISNLESVEIKRCARIRAILSGLDNQINTCILFTLLSTCFLLSHNLDLHFHVIISKRFLFVAWTMEEIHIMIPIL